MTFDIQSSLYCYICHSTRVDFIDMPISYDGLKIYKQLEIQLFFAVENIVDTILHQMSSYALGLSLK